MRMGRVCRGGCSVVSVLVEYILCSNGASLCCEVVFIMMFFPSIFFIIFCLLTYVIFMI